MKGASHLSNAVLKVTNQTLNKMKNHYGSFLKDKAPPSTVFAAKKDGITITAYQSGKVLFQGSGADKEAGIWGSSEPKSTPKKTTRAVDQHSWAPPANIKELSIIGSDEVGTGDYFGPMTVVAAFVSRENMNRLKMLGVKDSKNLTDTQISAIAKEIAPIIPHSLLVLHNEKYNDLQAKGMTQGKIKALLHNQAINHVIKKVKNADEINGVLIDQFVVPETYYRHIKGKQQDWKGKTYFATKGESVHLAVAAASIIARYAFVEEFRKLSEKAGMELKKGAGSQVDQVAARLIKQKGEEALYSFTKVHFGNTDKAKRLAQR